MEITWLGHACFRINSSKVIYIDPYELKGSQEKADIIFLTHTHYDHTSPEDIEKIKKDDTVFVVTADSPITENANVMQPGEKREIMDFIIEAVPAYNTDKPNHPKDKNWVGYIITADEKRIYHTGDSDVIPEMRNIKADILLIPVGGVYTMSADEAAAITADIKPEIAIPMHYGTIVGSDGDAELFKKLVEEKGIKVEIMKKGGSLEL